MADPIRWGILSTGGIARKFADALKHVEGAQLVAVGSRSQATADQFGDEYNVPRRYPNYAALAADSDIDVVYIGSPHPMHYADVMLCLEQGKAVLNEKPFTMTAAETIDLVRVARERKLFLMEAMWTRYLPYIVEARRLLAEGVLGRIQVLQADFGFSAPFDPTSRLYAPELGGGALLDVGVYVVSLASLIFGQQPEQVASFARFAPTGTDDLTGMLFRYADNALATLTCSVSVTTQCEAFICGEKGTLRIHPRWHGSGNAITLTLNGQPAQTIHAPVEHNGYQYEAEEVMRCLRAGELESPVMPLDETIGIMQTLDRVQQAWGR
ncbi:MAG: Gfo/Idh/MocA family oxidoreductase [Armatimonadetes bacterium]|nr:Gfo/Idh/MocA family oxidoreductase [Anaerolineae bacterium]